MIGPGDAMINRRFLPFKSVHWMWGGQLTNRNPKGTETFKCRVLYLKIYPAL